MYDLDHHLLRLDSGKHVLAHRLDFHAVAEFLGNLVADVGIEESLADVLDSLRDIYLGYFSFTFENLE